MYVCIYIHNYLHIHIQIYTYTHESAKQIYFSSEVVVRSFFHETASTHLNCFHVADCCNPNPTSCRCSSRSHHHFSCHPAYLELFVGVCFFFRCWICWVKPWASPHMSCFFDTVSRQQKMQQQKLAAYRQQEMLQALGQGASFAG